MSYIGKNPKVDSVKLDGSATVPTGATVEGQVYFNTGTGAISEGLKVYKNGQYVSIDKQLGDADTIDLLKAADIGGLQWGVAINSTSTEVGMNSPVPQYNATATGFASTSAFANSSTGNALLTNESADIVFAYESGAANCKNDYFGIQVDIPKAFRGGNLVLQFEYRTEEASGASSDNDFLVSIQDDTNKAQTTNSTTTGSQAAGTSVAVASSTGFAVGDFVRVESGTAASGNQANSFTEAYVTAIADSTHLTFSETIVFPASGTTGIIAANWLINQNAGQLVEADSDTNKVGKVYKVQFKTEETTAKINISIMNQSTTAAGIDIFVDNILLSANKFLQASSQLKSESYYAPGNSNFWNDTSDNSGWDADLVVPGFGAPPVAQSKFLRFEETSTTDTRVYARQDIDLVAGFTGHQTAGNQIKFYNSSGEIIAQQQTPDPSGHLANHTVNAALSLAKDDYIYCVNDSGTSRYGAATFLATGRNSDIVVLESQDEIFTDWNAFTMTPLSATGGGTITKGTIVVDNAFWRRVGGNMEIMWDYKQSTAGASGTGNTVFPIPSGYSIDTSKLYVSDSTTYANVGIAKASFSASNGLSTYAANGMVSAENSTQLALFFPGAYNYMTRVSSTNFGLGGEAQLGFTMRVSIPIVGWNANFNPLLSMPLVDFGSYSNIYSAKITNGGTAAIASQSESFIASVSRTGAGVVDITFNSGHFTQIPCIAVAGDTNSTDNELMVSVDSLSATATTIRTALDNGSTTDGDFWVTFTRQGSDFKPLPQPTAAVIKPAVAIIKNVQAYNVAGGEAASGTWGSIPLNTVTGESWYLTFNSTNYEITLEPGTYVYTASAPFYDTGNTQLMLYNETDSVVLTPGIPAYISTFEGVGFNTLRLEHTFTVTKSTVIRLKYRVETTQATNGLGYPPSVDSGVDAVYGLVKIEKLK